MAPLEPDYSNDLALVALAWRTSAASALAAEAWHSQIVLDLMPLPIPAH